MSNNFEGNVKKNANSFKPQTRANDGGVGKTVAGLWPGQEPVTVFEKAGPVLDTDKAPDAGHRGERELGVSVDRIDRDGGAEYTDPASVIRQSIAQLSGLTDTSSTEAIKRLSELADQIEGKNTVTRPYSDYVGRVGADYLKPVHKSAEPSLEDVKAELNKQVAILTERLRGLIARGAGVEVTERSGAGRFVTKAASGNDPKRLLKQALDNGVAVPFSGADPRSEAERASGSGRKFQTRR